MKLNYQNIKMIEVDDWDFFVKAVYNKPYNFQQQDGCKERGVSYFSVPLNGKPEDFLSDDIPSNFYFHFGVKFSSWLDKDPDNSSREFEDEMWWERNFYPHIEMIIEDLYKKGLIEEGDYGINIDW